MFSPFRVRAVDGLYILEWTGKCTSCGLVILHVPRSRAVPRPCAQSELPVASARLNRVEAGPS